MRLILLAAALTAVGCGSGTGQIMVTMTDAPVSDANVKNVFVRYDELRIHSEATQNAADAGPDAHADGVDGPGWIVLCSETRTVDLLALLNNVFTPVCTCAAADGGLEAAPITVPAGRISQLRLHITSARLTFKDGSPDQTLTIPSGSSSGLKINVQRDVPSGSTLELKLDFDAGASLTKLGNGTWRMGPVLRVLP